MLYIKKQSPFRLCFFFSILCFAEVILAYAAKGAEEILRKVLKFRAGGNSVLGVADSLVIFPAANVAYVFFHICFLSFCVKAARRCCRGFFVLSLIVGYIEQKRSFAISYDRYSIALLACFSYYFLCLFLYLSNFWIFRNFKHLSSLSKNKGWRRVNSSGELLIEHIKALWIGAKKLHF